MATIATRICSDVSLIWAIACVLLPPEQTDETGDALGVPFQLLPQLVTGEPRRQSAWLQVRGDHRKDVVVDAGARRRARPAVHRGAGGFLAAGEFVGRLAELALGKAGHVRLDIVGEQMMRTEAALPLPIR